MILFHRKKNLSPPHINMAAVEGPIAEVMQELDKRVVEGVEAVKEAIDPQNETSLTHWIEHQLKEAGVRMSGQPKEEKIEPEAKPSLEEKSLDAKPIVNAPSTVAESYISLVQEKVMVNSGQTASVLHHFMEVAETEALQLLLPVFIKAFSDIEAMVKTNNAVSLSQMGAQFVADIAATMPTLELDAVQAASALYQKILAVMIARESSSRIAQAAAQAAQAAPATTS